MQMQASRIESYAAEAYVYGYPLVLSNSCASERYNALFLLRDDDLERSIAQGARILSAAAWLDVRVEPVIVTIPSAERYYFVSFFDAWSNALHSAGPRVTGYDRQVIAVTGPLSQPCELPEHTRVIRAPSSLLRVSARTASYSESDMSAAADFQARCTITPLSKFRDQRPKKYISPVATVSQEQLVSEVGRLDALEFFSELASLLESNPLPSADAGMRDIVASLLRSEHRANIERGVESAKRRIAAYRPARMEVGGWFFDDASEQFGRDHVRRAAAAHARLFSDVRADYVRLIADTDSAGHPLDGRSCYRITFDGGNEPPARGGWLVGTRPLMRSTGSIVRRDSSGRTAISLQSDAPQRLSDHWLPLEPGPFQVVLHIFWPSEVILNGGWIAPPIELKA